MNDYISRDRVLKKFIKGDGHDDDRFTEGYNFAVHEHREEVENIPAADVQPVAHAEWIGFTKSAFLGCDDIGEPIFRDTTVWKCSHCGRNTVVRDNFCPNCGARMKGDK